MKNLLGGETAVLSTRQCLMPAANTPTTHALDDGDIALLQQQLDALPPPLQPLDVSAVDGYLCGVLLQPDNIDDELAMRWLLDVEGLPPPETFDTALLCGLLMRRKAELDRALRARQWFDPWVFELDDDALPGEAVLPWVAGFAAAMEHFPALLRIDDARLLEPLALLYMHFDPADLEDADALRQLIDTLEPPQDLGEAVQDLVRSLMLMADVARPRAAAAPPGHSRASSRGMRRSKRKLGLAR